jgi:hypothetical protein
MKIWWRLVVLGSDRPKRADTGPDPAARITSEDADVRQCYAVRSRRRTRRWESREITAQRLARTRTGAAHWIRVCGDGDSGQKRCTQRQHRSRSYKTKELGSHTTLRIRRQAIAQRTFQIDPRRLISPSFSTLQLRMIRNYFWSHLQGNTWKEVLLVSPRFGAGPGTAGGVSGSAGVSKP